MNKAAVIGTGSIGHRQMQVLQSMGVAVVSIPVRDARRSELESQGWSCADSLGDAKRSGATFAVIATDTSRHVKDAEEALNLGLHVLLEKPMAVSASSAKHLPPMAAERGLQLLIGCPLRFDPGLVAARQRIAEIGDVHSVRIECRSYLPDWRPTRDYRAAYSARADEGGVLRDLIHEVDYALWLFGVPDRVFGTLGNTGRLGIQSDEIAEGFWVAGRSGTRVSIGLDYLSRHPRRVLRANGDRGDLTYDFIERRLRLRTVGAPPEEVIFAKAPNDLYIQQMNEFMSVIGGGTPRLITLAEEGVSALAVCDAWRRSASSQRAEKLAP